MCMKMKKGNKNSFNIKKFCQLTLAFQLALYPTMPYAQSVGQTKQSFDEVKHQFKKVSKNVKELEHQFEEKINFKHYKNNFQQEIFVEDCSIGFTSQIKNEENRNFSSYDQEGNINVSEIESIDKLVKNNVSDIAHRIIFYPHQKTIYFNTISHMNDFYQKVLNLRKFCQQQNILAEELKQQYEVAKNDGVDCSSEKDQKVLTKINRLLAFTADDQVKEKINISDAPQFGLRPLHKKDQVENSDMEIALLKGQESLLQRLRLIKDAKKSLKYLTYQFMGDEGGKLLGEALIEKKKQGLDVEMVIDYFSTMLDVRDLNIRNNSYILFNNMMAAGIKVHGYDCVGGVGHFIKEMHNSYKFGDFGNRRLSIHEKVLIKDNEEAIIGGMNTQDRYYGLAVPGINRWRDQDVLIHGKNIIQDVTNVFDGTLATYQMNRISPDGQDRFNPYSEGSKKHQSYIKNNTHSCLNPHPVGTPEYNQFLKAHTKAYEKKPRGMITRNDIYTKNQVKNIKKGLIDLDHHQLSEFQPKFIPISKGRIIHSFPDIKQYYIEEYYVDMIDKSEKEIWIENAYFIPTPEIIRSLKNAIKRGVSVNIITNHDQTNDVPFIPPISRYYYKEFKDIELSKNAKGSFNAYEWIGKKDQKGPLRYGMLHAKTAVFDGKFGIVGSYNFDPASKTGNGEIILAYEGKKAAKALLNELKNDLNFSKPVSYHEMIQYRKPKKFKDKLLYNLSKALEDKL